MANDYIVQMTSLHESTLTIRKFEKVLEQCSNEKAYNFQVYYSVKMSVSSQYVESINSN